MDHWLKSQLLLPDSELDGRMFGFWICAGRLDLICRVV